MACLLSFQTKRYMVGYMCALSYVPTCPVDLILLNLITLLILGGGDRGGAVG
jgi:hypothetical protein